MFYQNHSLALYTFEIFCNLILRNHWTWTWKISDCLTGFGLTSWYIGLGLKRYLNYLTWMGLILWYNGVRLKKYSDYLTGFGLILWYIGLGLEKHLTGLPNLLDSNWFYYNQAGMLRGRLRDFEKAISPCRPPWLAGEENFRFQMVLKGQNNVQNSKFFLKYLYQYFQIFSIFIDKILSIFQNLLTLW